MTATEARKLRSETRPSGTGGVCDGTTLARVEAIEYVPNGPLGTVNAGETSGAEAVPANTRVSSRGPPDRIYE